MLSVTLAALLLAAATALAMSGQLTQLSGTAGCVGRSNGSPCGPAIALYGPLSPALSADGENLYVAGEGGGSLVLFRRDASTGQIFQLEGTAGCITDYYYPDYCARGRGLRGPQSVTVSGDGHNVYVASSTRGEVHSHAVAVFARDANSDALTQLEGTDGCLSTTTSLGACGVARAINGANSVVVSPDGKSVYVVAGFRSNAVAVFQRDAATGKLTQLEDSAGCIREGGGGCRVAKALIEPDGLAVSPDGRHVYAVSDSDYGAIAVFRRNTTTGALFQLRGRRMGA